MKRKRAWRTFLIALLAVSGWQVLTWSAAQALIVDSVSGQADAIVVLSGSSTYRERTQRAAQLFHEGYAGKIILSNDNLRSGWSQAKERNPLFVERAMDELQRNGVPPENIEIVPQNVTTTYDEAVSLREYLSTRNFRSILIVTSAYHSRRARWTFCRVFRGSNVAIKLEAVAPGQQTPLPSTWWWHTLGWKMVPGEYLKMIYYLIHYR